MAQYKNKLIENHAIMLEVYTTVESTLLEPANRVFGFETITKDQLGFETLTKKKVVIPVTRTGELSRVE
eukprot:1195412-Prorocentrum_minimum.AAC.2